MQITRLRQFWALPTATQRRFCVQGLGVARPSRGRYFPHQRRPTLPRQQSPIPSCGPYRSRPMPAPGVPHRGIKQSALCGLWLTSISLSAPGQDAYRGFAGTLPQDSQGPRRLSARWRYVGYLPEIDATQPAAHGSGNAPPPPAPRDSKLPGDGRFRRPARRRQAPERAKSVADRWVNHGLMRAALRVQQRPRKFFGTFARFWHIRPGKRLRCISRHKQIAFDVGDGRCGLRQ